MVEEDETVDWWEEVVGFRGEGSDSGEEDGGELEAVGDGEEGEVLLEGEFWIAENG